tara:strand:- start:42 stop:371 length:330 start_codon:yes stop_codon:yes gene_type:complete
LGSLSGYLPAPVKRHAPSALKTAHGPLRVPNATKPAAHQIKFFAFFSTTSNQSHNCVRSSLCTPAKARKIDRNTSVLGLPPFFCGRIRDALFAGGAKEIKEVVQGFIGD